MLWTDFIWTRHALQRIAEYGLRLDGVFSDFESSVEVEKNETTLIREFVRHGGLKALKSKLYQGDNYMFVTQGNVIVTVIVKQGKKRSPKDEREILERQEPWVKVFKNDKEVLMPKSKALKLGLME